MKLPRFVGKHLNLILSLILIFLFLIIYRIRDDGILHYLTNDIRWVFKGYGKLFLVVNFCLIIVNLCLTVVLFLHVKSQRKAFKNHKHPPVKKSVDAPVIQEGIRDQERRLDDLESNYKLTQLIIENIKRDFFNSKAITYVTKDSISPNTLDNDSRSLNVVPPLFSDISCTTDFPAQSTETLALMLDVNKTIIDLTIENFPENKNYFKDNSDFTPYSNSSLDNSVDPSGVAIVRLTSSSYFNAEFLLFNFQSCYYIIPNPCCTRFKTLMSTFEDSSPVYKFMDGHTQSSPKLIKLCKASPNDMNMWSIIETGLIG